MADENGAADENAAAAAAAAAAENAESQDHQQPGGDDKGAAGSPFAELQDADSRTWLEKAGINDVETLAKRARETEKHVGSSIRVPGKDATDEERETFLNKLGRPEKPEGYEFSPPKDLPEDIPYDGERASAFAAEAHKLGLTKDQAASLHDWFIGNTVADFNGLQEQAGAQTAEAAKAETEKLTKLWGPLTGDQMKTNLSFADRALRDVGGEDVRAELQRVGLIGKEGNMILSAPIAVMMAKVGRSLYKEDDVLRGDATLLDNPFEDGKAFNVTKQMIMIKKDRDTALGMIASAGKKPSDFGLKD